MGRGDQPRRQYDSQQNWTQRQQRYWLKSSHRNFKKTYDRHIKGVSKKVNKTHEQMSNLKMYRNSAKNTGRKKVEQSAQDLQDKIKSITYVMNSR